MGPTRLIIIISAAHSGALNKKGNSQSVVYWAQQKSPWAGPRICEMLSALKSFGPRCFWLPTSWQGRRARYGGGGGLSQVFGLTPGEEAFAGARGGLFGRGAFLVFTPA